MSPKEIQLMIQVPNSKEIEKLKNKFQENIEDKSLRLEIKTGLMWKHGLTAKLAEELIQDWENKSNEQ